MDNKRNLSTYYLRLILAIAIWAGMYHVAKPAVELSDPYLISFLRYLLASIAWLIILRIKNGYWVPPLSKLQWLLVFLIGLIGVCLYNLLFFSAEALTSGNIVAILYAFAPCLTTVMSAYFFKTRLNFVAMIGLLISLVGSIGVINYTSPSCGKFFCSDILAHLGYGEIYACLATLVFAIYSVLSRYTAQQNVSSVVMNTYACVFGGLCLALIAVFKADFSVLVHVHLSFWLALFYIAFLGTVLGYLWFVQAIIHLGVFKTVIFQNTLPLQVIVIGYLFFNESVTLSTLLCGLIIIFGVYLTNLALTRSQISKNRIKTF